MLVFVMKITDNKILLIYFVLIIGLLTLLYFPIFTNAPRSDWWESLYFFHSIYNNPGHYSWIHIINTDCWGHVTYRPLAHMVLFIQHYIFGSDFFYMHIINFSLYCISLILLYKFAMLLNIDRILALVFIGIFGFLFSHFDIVSWTVHSHLIFSFCSLLLGNIIYIKFLKSGRTILLFFVSLLFLLGIFCYEAFIFWPLSIIFFSYMDKIINSRIVSRTKIKKSYITVISSIYLIYIVLFFLTRAIQTYNDTWVRTQALLTGFLYIRRIFETFFAVCFNILYTQISVNIIPVLGTPVWFDNYSSNIRMGGFLEIYRPTMFDMRMASVIVVLIIAGVIIYLAKRKRFEIMKKFILFCFLLFSFLFILFHSKYFSNKEYLYNFQQFRYQYVPNAIIIMVFLLFFDQLFKHTSKRKIKTVIYLILFVIFVTNISFTVSAILLESRQMAPLNKLLSDIKEKILEGGINKHNKLYIDDDIVDVLPEMCWNTEMEMFTEGTIQWVFDKKEIKCFSNSIEEASWFIDSSDLEIKPRFGIDNRADNSVVNGGGN